MASRGLGAAMVASAVLAGVFIPARAHAQRGGDFVGGILGGIIAGAIVANSRPAYGYVPQRRVVRARPVPRRAIAVAAVGAGVAALPLATKQVSIINASADPFAMSGGSSGLVTVSDKR